MEKLTRELYAEALQVSLSKCESPLKLDNLVTHLRDEIIFLLQAEGDQLSPIKLEKELGALVRGKLREGGNEQAAINFLKQTRPAVEALWFRLGRSKTTRAVPYARKSR